MASGHANDEVGETKIHMKLLPTLEIITPGTLTVTPINIPETSSAQSSLIEGAVKATTNWVIQVKESSTPPDGKMRNTEKKHIDLIHPIVVDIETKDGIELGRATLSNKNQELVSGEPGIYDLIYTFEQVTEWGDYDGEYSIQILYKIRPMVSSP